MQGLGQMGTAYQAITNAGTFDIGDFGSYNEAYAWSAARYGNDFLGVATVPVVKSPAAPAAPTMTNYLPLLLGALVVWYVVKKL